MVRLNSNFNDNIDRLITFIHGFEHETSTFRIVLFGSP